MSRGVQKVTTIQKEDLSNQYIIEKNASGEFEAVIVDTNIDEDYLETLYNIRSKRSNKKVALGHSEKDAS